MLEKRMRTLVAIPVYNEARYIDRVISRVLRHADDVLVIDDGSTDDTPLLLAKQPVDVIRHRRNLGYGRSLQDAFRWADACGVDWIVTLDCDEQHEPEMIPAFLERARAGDADVVSGSRYLRELDDQDAPPVNRRAINAQITAEINHLLADAGVLSPITDGFCGFKAYRVDAIAPLDLHEDGYAFPMRFWAEAAAARLRVDELPVRLIYNDPNRSFGGGLDNDQVRLAHYRDVLHRSIERRREDLPEVAAALAVDERGDAAAEVQPCAGGCGGPGVEPSR
jgi:dolichol-phosphate mannosyltransferase